MKLLAAHVEELAAGQASVVGLGLSPVQNTLFTQQNRGHFVAGQTACVVPASAHEHAGRDRAHVTTITSKAAAVKVLPVIGDSDTQAPFQNQTIPSRSG